PHAAFRRGPLTAATLDFFVREEARDHLAREARRAQRFGVDAAPARLDLGEHLLAALDYRFVEGARALHLFEDHRRDHAVVEEGGAAIGDLVLQRDPQML